MDNLYYIFEIFLHLDKYLSILVGNYGIVVHILIFAVIFLETGVVLTPFLPGDSLLFVAGALSAASGSLNIGVLFAGVLICAILGDSANYSIGKYFGIQFGKEDGKRLTFIRPEHLEKTKKFYEKYGNKTILFARFVPMVRTIAPFLAGFGEMKYSNFIYYNITGAFAWVTLCLLGGYFFGNIQIVKDNFSFVVLGIIIVSLIPATTEYLRHKFKKQ